MQAVDFKAGQNFGEAQPSALPQPMCMAGIDIARVDYFFDSSEFSISALRLSICSRSEGCSDAGASPFDSESICSRKRFARSTCASSF